MEKNKLPAIGGHGGLLTSRGIKHTMDYSIGKYLSMVRE